MRKSLVIALSASLGAMLFCAPSVAHAEDEEPLPKPRPTPADDRSGRPTIGLQLGWQRIFGSAEDNVLRSSFASWGAAPGLQLAFPVTRHFAVEGWGSLASFKNHTDDCRVCTASTFSLGIGAVYHLVDGIAFDPWFSAGVGYRKTHLATPDFSVDYTGFDFLRWTMWMDYYPARYIGFGPYTTLALGEYASRSIPGGMSGHPVHSTFEAGMRVVFRPFLDTKRRRAPSLMSLEPVPRVCRR